MRSNKKISVYLASSLAGVSLLLGTTSALAQSVGSLEYSPDSVTAIPVGGGLFLVLLGVLLAVLGYRKISLDRVSRHVLPGIFLGLLALSFTMAGGQLLYKANASDSTDLDNPHGDVVTIWSGYQEYRNTSGTLLHITRITLNCQVGVQDEGATLESGSGPISKPSRIWDQCIAGETVLNENEICTTNYPPCGDA